MYWASRFSYPAETIIKSSPPSGVISSTCVYGLLLGAISPHRKRRFLLLSAAYVLYRPARCGAQIAAAT